MTDTKSNNTKELNQIKHQLNEIIKSINNDSYHNYEANSQREFTLISNSFLNKRILKCNKTCFYGKAKENHVNSCLSECYSDAVSRTMTIDSIVKSTVNQ